MIMLFYFVPFYFVFLIVCKHFQHLFVFHSFVCITLHLCFLGSQNVLHRPILRARQTMPHVSLFLSALTFMFARVLISCGMVKGDSGIASHCCTRSSQEANNACTVQLVRRNFPLHTVKR